MSFVEEWDNLVSEAYAISKTNGFHEGTENAPEKICLMHSELSEALEALRNGNPPDKHLPDLGNLEVELADCLIRIADFCGTWGLNVGRAVIEKMAYNRTREYKHGGKKF